jgi:hypothetical protein
VVTSDLSLLVQKHFVDAGVEGRAREHGGDGVGQVQHGLEHRVHGLKCKDIQGFSLIDNVELISLAILPFLEMEKRWPKTISVGAH